jgi:diguanylate cyclase (GGDEF)-like protein
VPIVGRVGRAEGSLIATFPAAELSLDQAERLCVLCREIADAPDAETALRLLTDRIFQILGVSAIVYRRDVGPLKLTAQADAEPPSAAPAPAELVAALQKQGPSVVAIELDGGARRQWTAVGLSDRGPTESTLLLPGDWTTSPAASWLRIFVAAVSLCLQLVGARREHARSQELAMTAYDLTRQVGSLSDRESVHHLIVEATARAVRADRGALAVFDNKTARLDIVATHGHAEELVGRVQIQPGEGIIGGVFASGRALLVTDITRVPGLPRARAHPYRTPSFIAVPLVAGREVLGVLTLADRSDGKPFDHSNLTMARVLAVTAALALERENFARQSQELSLLAAVDPLTGLFNRRYFEARLDVELERARRHGTELALLFVDIDDFKVFNDSFGHLTGDSVLRHVAETLRRAVRALDVCTRYGGDEFAVLVSGADPEAALRSAERIRQRVSANPWESPAGGARSDVTVSVGVTFLASTDQATSLVTRADLALYRAKAGGKNCVRMFSPENSWN